MSCDCNTPILSACGDVNVPVVSAGMKISQLPTITSASPNDLFVIVDYSAQQTKNITFYDLTKSISEGTVYDVSGAGTYLRTSGDWIYFDPDTKLDTSAFYPMSAIDHTIIQNIGTHTHDQIDTHIEDLTIHFPMSAINGLSPAGGDVGEVLTKTTSGDYDYTWAPPTGGGDVFGPISATNNNIVVYDGATGKLIKDGGSTISSINSSINAVSSNLFDHESDLNIHYVMSAINHTVIQNIGTHTHAEIDTHIEDLNIHYPDVIDLSTYIRTSGSWVEFDPNTKVETSAMSNYTTTADFTGHTSNTSIHYVMSAIDHTVIKNIGTHSHTTIDSHINDLTIHFPMSSINGLTPIGGTSGQVLTKTTSGDYDYVWATTPSSIPLNGATSARPLTPATGTPYLDTTLGYPIWYLPPNWINSTGAIV